MTADAREVCPSGGPAEQRHTWPLWASVLISIVSISLSVALVALFINAPDLYPLTSYGDSAARTAAIATTRTASLAGILGIAAVVGLVINGITARANASNARSAQLNVRIAQEAQSTAQEIATATANATRETLRLTERGELTERYIRSVELLGKENEMSVIGGIYALERLVKDSLDDRPTIVEVLSAFVRKNAALVSPQVACAVYRSTDSDPAANVGDACPKDWQIPVCLRAALSVLGRIALSVPKEPDGFDALAPQKWREYNDEVRTTAARADLRGVNLRNIELPRADLRGADFSDSDLTGANLIDADLRFARFVRSDLSGAKLIRANLTGADLMDAHLNRADLAEAIFGGPYLNPRTAPILSGTDLTGAALQLTDFRGVYLGYVHGLLSKQLEHTIGDSGTNLAKEMDRPSGWGSDDRQ